jgi:hypothetical protein
MRASNVRRGATFCFPPSSQACDAWDRPGPAITPPRFTGGFYGPARGVARGWSGQPLSIFVPATTRGRSRRALWDVKTDVVAAVGETAVEVVLPDGGSCLQLCCSGWSWVVGVDAVGGPPHRDFTDDGEVRMAARRRPHRLGFVLAGVTSNLVGEVGN